VQALLQPEDLLSVQRGDPLVEVRTHGDRMVEVDGLHDHHRVEQGQAHGHQHYDEQTEAGRRLRRHESTPGARAGADCVEDTHRPVYMLRVPNAPWNIWVMSVPTDGGCVCRAGHACLTALPFQAER